MVSTMWAMVWELIPGRIASMWSAAALVKLSTVMSAGLIPQAIMYSMRPRMTVDLPVPAPLCTMVHGPELPMAAICSSE